MLLVNSLDKAYDGTLAVWNLNLLIEPGEVWGLVGPNGAGKTTTLRCITGIIPVTRGSINVGGFDVVKQPVDAKRVLAYIPDDPKLYDALTVWEHFEFVAAAYDVDDWEPRAEELLERFELAEKRNTLAQELSRGMRQKTAVICGYIHQPRLVMYDEPIAGLDPRGIRTLKESMTELAESGTALIVSSHMLNLVEDVCTHLLILHSGCGLYCGPVSEARTGFQDLHTDASLEDVFFRATEGDSGRV